MVGCFLGVARRTPVITPIQPSALSRARLPTLNPHCALCACRSVLYLAYKHADSFEDAVLANTNVGGENCHRGSALVS